MVLELFHFSGSSSVCLCHVPTHLSAKWWESGWEMLPGVSLHMKLVEVHKADVKTTFFFFFFPLWAVTAQPGWEQPYLHPSLSLQHPLVHPHFHSLRAINLNEEEHAHVQGFAFLPVCTLQRGTHAATPLSWLWTSGSVVRREHHLLTCSFLFTGLWRLQQGLIALFSLLSAGLYFNECSEGHSALLCHAKGHNLSFGFKTWTPHCKACPCHNGGSADSTYVQKPTRKVNALFASLQWCCACRTKTILWVFDLCQVGLISGE